MKCVPCLLGCVVLTFAVIAGLSKLTTDARVTMVENELMVSESMTPAEQAYRICLQKRLGPVGIISVTDVSVCAEESNYYGEQ